ncbi:HugZ family pyridoxamine 5'-phosphate oxidase [Oceanicola sp. S124]|uniref:HugZ family pyridoxamine 5'-phosphate oxidase n=1 Tax=Oceanicola sp. S124 TaxID=1042378 RepID=UPI00025590F4|nr:pyridoxamine 5'-phosphate oxidase family protein [Oceanicola sp. S124]
MAKTDPIRPTDDEARALARALLDKAPFAALGVLRDGAPLVTRIALFTPEDGVPVTLVSRLAAHTGALLEGQKVSLLVGEPGGKGDPLTHPRLSLQAIAEPVTREDPRFDALSRAYVAARPKSKLYIGFADFLLVRFRPEGALLNGGFGAAFRLTPEDLMP